MFPPIANLSAFLSELKRRRVFRVAIVYAGVAFIIIQIVDAIFVPLNIPDWVGTTIIVLLLIGFPIAVRGALMAEPPSAPSPGSRLCFRN